MLCAVTCALAPAYALRWHLGPLPTTVLEDAILVTLVAFAAETVRTRQPVAWRNPDSGRYGSVVPGSAYEANGMNCRPYTHTIYIDGRPQTTRGTACRNPDGTWQPV